MLAYIVNIMTQEGAFFKKNGKALIYLKIWMYDKVAIMIEIISIQTAITSSNTGPDPLIVKLQ